MVVPRVENSRSSTSTSRVGEPVEQGRLPRVGVAHERDRRDPPAQAGLALHRPGLVELIEVALELGDPPQDAPAVDLELGLTGTPGADARALLAELDAATAQAGEAVAQLRELHLQHALLAGGVLGEDVEDQRDAVDDVALEQRLEVALLRGRQLVVEHHDVDVERVGELAQLRGLALADVGRGVGPVAALELALDRVGTRGVDEERELVERLLRLLGRAGPLPGADEERALADDLEVDLGRGEPAPTARDVRVARTRRIERVRGSRPGRGARPGSFRLHAQGGGVDRRRRTRARPGHRGGSCRRPRP